MTDRKITIGDGGRINIGVVLSGGFAKGAYEAGFIRAVLQHTAFSVKAVSAASVGTLNGYSLCVGKTALAREVWKRFDARSSRDFLERLLRRREIYRIIDSFCSEKDVLSAPLYTVCWTPPGAKVKYVRLNDCNFEEKRDFLKAAVTIPPFMKPIEINGRKYLDGAVIDNTPLAPLSDRHAGVEPKRLDLIISVQFDGYIPSDKTSKICCPILFLNLQDLVGVMDSFHLDSDNIERMIEYGYQTTDSILTLIESKYDDYAAFRLLIDRLNLQIKEQKLSGDRLMRKINRLSEYL